MIQLKNVLPKLNLPESTIEIAGVTTKGSNFTETENNALINMLDKLYYVNSMQSIKNNIAENYDILVDVIRAVKTNTKQPFEGVFAKGNSLTLKPLHEEDFNTVFGQTTDKTFEYDVVDGTVYDYIGTSAQPETTVEEEAIIILGFLEMNPDPKIYKVKFSKNGEDYIPQSLEFNEVEEDQYVPLPEPYVILPESTYNIKVKADETGTTYLVPIGFRILMAKVAETLF